MSTAPKLREKELQAAILDMAKKLGWRYTHFQPAMRSNGSFATPMQGHPGFPDLVLLRPPRIVFAELKTGYNKPTHDQALWLNGLDVNHGVEVYLWRQTDWESGAVEAVLS